MTIVQNRKIQKIEENTHYNHKNYKRPNVN